MQGTTWKSPPILDDPSDTMRMAGRKYKLYYDGNRLRLVSWSTPRAVYWVSNTLSKTLTNPQMLAIARSLSRFGGESWATSPRKGLRASRAGCTSASCSRA